MKTANNANFNQNHFENKQEPMFMFEQFNKPVVLVGEGGI